MLSLVAHLLLGIYLTTVNIVTDQDGSPDGRGIQVALVDSGMVCFDYAARKVVPLPAAVGGICAGEES